MNIQLSQQVSATYARNHFKEVMANVRDGTPQVIIHKSQPDVIIMRIEDLKKLEEQSKPKKKVRKFNLEEIRKNSTFAKYRGCMDDYFDKNLSSVEICKRWTDYVD